MLLLEHQLLCAWLAVSAGDGEAALAHALDHERFDDTTEAARLLLLTVIAYMFDRPEARAAVAERIEQSRASAIRCAQVAAAVGSTLDLPASQAAPRLRETAELLERGERHVDAVRLRLIAWELDASDGRIVLDDARSIERQARSIGLRPEADRLARQMRDHGASGSTHGRRRGDSLLTEREREIIELVASGLGNADIAQRLGVKPDTVTRRLTNAYRRTGTSSRIELVNWYEQAEK